VAKTALRKLGTGANGQVTNVPPKPDAGADALFPGPPVEPAVGYAIDLWPLDFSGGEPQLVWVLGQT
jgi:hypothetical protein